MSIDEAALYEVPFEYVRTYVKPFREKRKRTWYRDEWWLHYASSSGDAGAAKHAFAASLLPRLSLNTDYLLSHQPSTIPDHQLIVFARDDDYFFGVLHSKIHELWSLRKGTSLEDRPRYTPTTTFETFPFPWPPGKEPTDDPRVQAIAAAAKELDEKRNAWLNPPGLSEKELKKRTLTNLYNARPTWLANLHETLDKAVFAAYGWPDTLTDQEILEKLLELNLERAEGQKKLL